MKLLVNKIFNMFGVEIRSILPEDISEKNKVISLRSKSGFRGNMLLAYLNKPFLLAEGESFPNSHTNYWECWQIANTFLDLGYNVDVIDYFNHNFTPQKEYNIFVGHRHRFERLSELLCDDCLKIAHLDTAHWIYNNYATNKRALEIQQRRGVTVSRGSQRIVEPNMAIEYADFATVLGNEFTINTYKFSKKLMFKISISTCETYLWPENKDFDICRNSYLWFGNEAMVHKGLDLVLDAFKDMPEYRLTICGPVEKEKYFVKAYYKELYQSQNIKTIGWINTSSIDFINILNNCVGLIYPSCSEGQNGGVITCMHGGLIPIVSYESGVDVEDSYGIILKNSSIEEIKSSIRKISKLPSDQLQCMARRSWEFARNNHTRDRFAEEYRKAIEEIINLHAKRKITPVQINLSR
jgi:glycosyltransferase involved in cell wall biosynthesis